MKKLLKILSDNRKFITAFVGLYVAYTVGYSQGSNQSFLSSTPLSLLAGSHQVAQAQELNSVERIENDGVVLGSAAALGSGDATSSSSSVTTDETQEKSDSNTSNSNSQGGTNTSTSIVAGSTPKPSALPSPNATNAASSSPTALARTINASGKYSMMGQDITYELTTKSSGGSVSGTVGGACSGKIDGNFEGRDGGTVSGKVSGSCGVGFISKKLDATYTGKVYLNKGIVNITLHGEIPFVEGDQSFSLSF